VPGSVNAPNGARPKEVSVLRTICFYTLLMLAVTFIGTALARPETAGPVAPDLPAYELMGMPITPTQMQLLGSPHVRERSPTPALAVQGMPASPHQLAVLAPRPQTTRATSASASVTPIRLTP
jgi:hypothetical protein